MPGLRQPQQRGDVRLETGQHHQTVDGTGPARAAQPDGQQREPGAGNGTEGPVRQFGHRGSFLPREFRHQSWGLLVQHRLRWGLIHQAERMRQRARPGHGHRRDHAPHTRVDHPLRIAHDAPASPPL